MKKLCRAVLGHLFLAVAALSLVAPAAQAQVRTSSHIPPTFPSVLRWKQMDMVSLNFHPKYQRSAEDPANLASAKALWEGIYEPYLDQNKASPLFFLLSEYVGPNFKIVASLIDMPLDFDRCEPPGNGSAVTDMFSKCMVSLAIVGKTTLVSRFDGYCFLHVDNDPNNPLSKNHTEFAYDPRTATAYFRTMQHGKVVPGCNRAIQLKV